MPGRPEVGTSMWGLIFEPQSRATSQQINTEIQRVVAQDPRITISDINVFAQENGILVELEVETIAGQNAEIAKFVF
jgi:phage baseplate assembly protein W